MNKSYDRMPSTARTVSRARRFDGYYRRSARLGVVAEELGRIGNELKLEMFAQMHDPLVAVALGTWSDRVLDLAVFAQCGSGKTG